MKRLFSKSNTMEVDLLANENRSKHLQTVCQPFILCCLVGEAM